LDQKLINHTLDDKTATNWRKLVAVFYGLNDFQISAVRLGGKIMFGSIGKM